MVRAEAWAGGGAGFSASEMSPSPTASHAGPVLLYDGECGLCNRAVRMLLRIDRGAVLRFATLQGVPGQDWLGRHGLALDNFSTLVFVRDWEGGDGGPGDYALRTDGLAAALETCGGLGTMLAWIRFVPRPVRDGAYKLVSRLRYRIFGEWRPRPLARPEFRERFIDGPPF
jgi:predicted DCC family thiol-disulfide oxidoreductase YuxK